uniref:Non-specific protein-tyrosine kinase n=1 Tax=Panagrellus redivivus TaxID=6233 RepID=A0A7E4VHI0_PANRE
MGSNENVDIVEAKADRAAERAADREAERNGEGAPTGIPSEGEKGSDGQNSGNKKVSDSAPSPATPSPAGAETNNGTVYVKPTNDNNLEQDRGRNTPERVSGNAPTSSNQRDADNDDDSDSSSGNGILSGLQGDDMFHGMLPDEDIDKLLTTDGDFIINTVEKVGKGRTIGITVLWGGQRRFISVRSSEAGATCDMINYKKTILECVRYHMNEQIPVTILKNMQAVLLRRPILREEWELRNEDIHKGDKIGEGAFGEVCLGRLKQRNKGEVLCALKVIKGNVTKGAIEEAMKEARIMRQYNHPNLVRFYGAQVEIEPLILVMEFVKGGSLDKWLKKNSQQISVQHRASMCYDAACGLEYLHAHNCIHRDIAARNCLLDISARRLKISDFGLSSIGTVQVLDPSKPAPIRWLSPEVIRTGCFGKPADVWSFGVLCWEIYMDAEIPYKEYTMGEVQARIMDENFRLRLPLTCQTELRKLISSCWIGDMNRRPTMADCVSTLRPFFDEKGKYMSDDAIKKAKKNKIKMKKPKKDRGDRQKVSKAVKMPDRRVPDSEGASSGVTAKPKTRTPSRVSQVQPVVVPTSPKDARRRKTKPKKGEEDEEEEEKDKSKEKDKKPKKRQKSCKSIKPRPRDSDSEEKKKEKTRDRDAPKKRRGKSTKSGCSPPNDKTSGKKTKKKPTSGGDSQEERKKPVRKGRDSQGRKDRKKDSDSEDTRKKDKRRRK